MKKLSKILLLLLLTGLCLSDANDLIPSRKYFPPSDMPTLTEGRENEERNNEWLEALHRAAPNTDWRDIEYANQITFQERKVREISFRQDDCGDFLIADGDLSAEWSERGSINQAGSVYDTEYDPETDEIWVLSAGGSLWKGPRSGNEWEIVNQDLRFSPGLLKFIPYNNKKRLVAFINRIPHFSDNGGITWSASEGVFYEDRTGNFSDPVVLSSGNKHLIYVLSTTSRENKVTLYRSSDLGETFFPIHVFTTNLLSDVSLLNPVYSDRLLVIQKEEHKAPLLEVDTEKGSLNTLGDGFDFLRASANLSGWMQDTVLHLFAYNKEVKDNGRQRNIKLFYSMDSGNIWTERGTLFSEPWEVGIFISPSDPKVMYYGEIDCFKSTDAGKNWEPVNRWWQYYDNIQNFLHADIMNFAEFDTKDGDPFTLVSSHGGVSISYVQFSTQTNIGLQNLNVSQYYSVKTAPTDNNIIYAGSQDQGFQVNKNAAGEGILSFEQTFSGDYHYVTFTNGGQALWTVYIGGWVGYFADAQNTEFVTASYLLESEDEFLWFPPIIPNPVEGENGVLMIGGNINGGPGSYLIRILVEGEDFRISQFDFDFKEASEGGLLSAIATSPINSSLWYAATTNGQFFYSADAGQTWSASNSLDQEANFLYGQKILPSKTDEQTVYLAGSGYSNPPVYVSNDHGVTFKPMNKGLPSTLILDLDSDPDENFLLAATEAGPYIFLQEKASWFSLNPGCAPNQTYWAVEYIPNQKIARFGTFGRGIWDLEINTLISNTNVQNEKSLSLKVFPNPTIETAFLELPEHLAGKDIDLSIFSIDGHLARSITVSSVNKKILIDFTGLPAATYLLLLKSGDQVGQQKIILAEK